MSTLKRVHLDLGSYHLFRYYCWVTIGKTRDTSKRRRWVPVPEIHIARDPRQRSGSLYLPHKPLGILWVFRDLARANTV